MWPPNKILFPIDFSERSITAARYVRTMFPPKKILFPVDFCEQCIGASRFVEAMTGRLEAELVLLHVLVSPGYYGLPEPLAAAETQLAAFQRDEFRYFRVRRMVEKAEDAAEKILAISRAENVDLIMMPTSGIGRYRRFILGSVTAKVLHDADCPVWTGVHLEQAPPLEALRIQNVVCAVDLKPHSERVLAWAQQISSEYQAALYVVHATSAHETRPARYFDAELALHLEMEGKEAIQEFLNARRVEAAIDVHGGEVAHVVRCAAQRLHADLVVIGRSFENGLVGRLRENAYSIIRQSPCPVVSV